MLPGIAWYCLVMLGIAWCYLILPGIAQCFQFCLQGFEAWLQGLPTGL
jgi:hypothetical protein